MQNYLNLTNYASPSMTAVTNNTVSGVLHQQQQHYPLLHNNTTNLSSGGSGSYHHHNSHLIQQQTHLMNNNNNSGGTDFASLPPMSFNMSTHSNTGNSNNMVLDNGLPASFNIDMQQQRQLNNSRSLSHSASLGTTAVIVDQNQM